MSEPRDEKPVAPHDERREPPQPPKMQHFQKSTFDERFDHGHDSKDGDQRHRSDED